MNPIKSGPSKQLKKIDPIIGNNEEIDDNNDDD
jgi:hypothetical protein